MASYAPQDILKSPRKRRRPARSCQECRRRKVKCDLKQPCGQCEITRCACVYNLSLAPKQAAAVSAIPWQSTGFEPEQPGLFHSKGLAEESLPNQHGSHALLPIHESKGYMEDELTNLRRRIRVIEEHLALPSIHNLNSKVKPWRTEFDSVQYTRHLDNFQRELPSKNQILALNKSRLYGPTHWLHGGHEFKRVAVLNKDTDQSTEEEPMRQQKIQLERLFYKCKHLAQKLKQNDPGRSVTRSGSGLSMSCKGWADQMMQLYVTHFESAFRILHVPSFRQEYEEFWKNPEQSSMALQFKIKLVIAIGSSLYRDTADTDNVRWSSCQWVHEAQTWVSGPVEKDRISLTGLQIQCLLILARQVLSIGADLVWIAVGTLVRTAMHMGLHRDPTHFRTMTVLHGEVRRRLWATILEMNVQASLDSGVPLAISFDDFDTNNPWNVNDEDIDESTETLPQYAENTVTDMSVQLILLRHLQPRGEIIRRMNGASSNFSQDEVQSLTLTLNRACRECSANLVGSNGDTTEVFKHNVADLLLRRFLLTLHRPLATASRVGEPGFHFSRKVCLDSATALLLPPYNPDFYHVTCIGSGIFKNRIIHASLAICSDLIIELEELNSTEWPSTYRKMLIDVLREAVRQTAERINLGETNLRLNMKLNVVLCRAECTESGSTRQLRMIEAAQESLKMAYAVMQSRLSLTNGRRDEEGYLERSELDWQNLGISIDEDWDESYDMPDIGLDELLWLGIGEGDAAASNETE